MAMLTVYWTDNPGPRLQQELTRLISIPPRVSLTELAFRLDMDSDEFIRVWENPREWTLDFIADVGWALGVRINPIFLNR